MRARSTDIVVLKFGSSVLRTPADLPWAVQEIYAHRRRGAHVIAVVSAFAGVTDALYARAREHGTDARATAALVATGELESASLLTLALDRCGVPARLLEPRAVALHTRGDTLDAEPVDVALAPFAAALAAAGVVVFPGFCGVGDDGTTTLLGRGGSDLTALFLVERLQARCVLVKDVDGLYERDPALPGPRPARFDRITWEDALRVGGKVVQPKTLRSARLHGQSLEIRAVGSPHSTLVGPQPSVLSRANEPRPLRVALLGLGVVGGGVYERLASRPDLFAIVRVVVRDRARHVARGVPAELVSTNPWEALAARPDVIVEALGGIEPAADLMLAALLDERCVVTANKAVLAAHYDAFAPFLADRRLRCAAAVGGAVAEEDRVAIVLEDGTVEVLAGRGAGRAPTTTAVVAELLDALAETVAATDVGRVSSRRGASA